jgi:hypothetical protein
VLYCAAVLFSTRSLPHVLPATAMALSVAVRVLREEARVTWVCWCCFFMMSWHLGAFSQQPVAGVQAGATKAGRLPAVRPAWVN